MNSKAKTTDLKPIGRLFCGKGLKPINIIPVIIIKVPKTMEMINGFFFMSLIRPQIK